MVVDDALDRVERDSEARAAPVDVEVDDVAGGRAVLDLPEPEQVGPVVVKVLSGVVQRVECDRLPPHVGLLAGAGEEQPDLAGITPLRTFTTTGPTCSGS